MKKVLLITIALIITVLSTRADNTELMQKSDSLFARGVELYNEGKFEEAKSKFWQSIFSGNETFEMGYYLHWWVANCDFKLGKIKKAAKMCPLYYAMQPTEWENIVDWYIRGGGTKMRVEQKNSVLIVGSHIRKNLKK